MASSVRPHLPEDELHEYCDGELSPSQRTEVAEHLHSCLICRAAHAEVMALRERVSELLAHTAPPVMRRLPEAMPLEAPVVAPSRWVVRRGSLLAAGFATLLSGAWYFLQPAPSRAPVLGLAGAVVTPPLFARPSLTGSLGPLLGTAQASVPVIDPVEADPAPN